MNASYAIFSVQNNKAFSPHPKFSKPVPHITSNYCTDPFDHSTISIDNLQSNDEVISKFVNNFYFTTTY